MKSISKAHFLLVITTAVFMITGIVMSFLPAQIRMDMPTWFIMSVGSLTILVPPVIYCAVKRISLPQAIGLKKTRPVNVLMAVLVLICFTTNLPVMLLVMAVLPAISEELLFRGILYNTYRKAAPLMGVFLSALFFALLHGNFNQIPYAFFLGLVLALMMEATGSIIIPVIMHFLMNGSNVLISYAMKPVFFKEQVMSGLDGFAETESILQSLTAAVGPDGLKVVIAIYAFIALLFAAAVAALIYATFLINRKPVKSLVIPGRSIRQRLSLLDWWVAVFIGLMLVRMILLI